jgi:hypothetical protein
MALWKRGKWYWADFTVNGTRYRVCLKDRGKRISVAAQDGELKAIRAEERAKLQAEQGQLSFPLATSPAWALPRQASVT